MAGVFRDLFSKPPGLLQLMPRSAERQKALQETGEIPAAGGFQHRFCRLCEAKRRRQLRESPACQRWPQNDAIVYGLLHVRGIFPIIFTHAPCTAGAVVSADRCS